ncbi:hypothetical protein ACMZOO_07995 [Catenovulum sp. SX2]|uniref:hypothetical protein n=1 Tax=Catenovulum sp. SX2 TaxID=3398614 RepID=UPI003F84BB3B
MSDVQLLSAMLYLVGYLYPIFFVLTNNNTKGQEKNLWLFVMSILSWFGLFVYVMTVPGVLSKYTQRYFPAYLYRKP